MRRPLLAPPLAGAGATLLAAAFYVGCALPPSVALPRPHGAGLAPPGADERPAFDQTLGSAMGLPFSVHGPADQTALIAQIRDAADRAWQAEIVDGGWAAPPPDSGGPDSGFDFYVDPSLAEGQGYTLPEDPVVAVAWNAATSFTVLPAMFRDQQTLASVVAHELNHASQFALDAVEDDAFYEHTAVFVEQRVVDYVTEYGVGIGDFQAHPERALDYLGTDYYEYGGALWLMFLSERLGDGGHALVQRLWQDSRQAGEVNDPSFLDALDGILAERGWTRGRFFSTFAIWRYFTGPRDDGAHFRVGAQWGTDSLVPTVSDALDSGPVVHQAELAPFGAALGELDLGATRTVSVRLEGGSHVAVALQPLSLDHHALGEPIIVEGDVPTTLSVPADTVRLVWALTSAPVDYAPPSDDWTPTSATFSISASDGDTNGGAGGKGGCSFAAAAGSLGGGVVVLVLVFVLMGAALRPHRREKKVVGAAGIEPATLGV